MNNQGGMRDICGEGEPLGPTQGACLKHDPTAKLGYGSQPVGGPCTSAAQQPEEKNLNIDQMVERLEGRLNRVAELAEDNTRRELSIALARAEEQGYRIGFDAAEAVLLEQRGAERKQTDAVMAFAAQTIREQRDTIKSLREEVAELELELLIR